MKENLKQLQQDLHERVDALLTRAIGEDLSHTSLASLTLQIAMDLRQRLTNGTLGIIIDPQLKEDSYQLRPLTQQSGESIIAHIPAAHIHPVWVQDLAVADIFNGINGTPTDEAQVAELLIDLYNHSKTVNRIGQINPQGKLVLING